MMELSDNVTYMKLLHELKAEFPNMPDDLVRQSIQKVGQLFEIAKSVKNPSQFEYMKIEIRNLVLKLICLGQYLLSQIPAKNEKMQPLIMINHKINFIWNIYRFLKALHRSSRV